MPTPTRDQQLQAVQGDQEGPCGNNKACSGHGRCVGKKQTQRSSEDEECACEPGWAGSYCQTPCPGLTSDGLYCSGAGSCSREGICTCDSGRWGPLCEHECPGGESNSCNNHGVAPSFLFLIFLSLFACAAFSCLAGLAQLPGRGDLLFYVMLFDPDVLVARGSCGECGQVSAESGALALVLRAGLAGLVGECWELLGWQS